MSELKEAATFAQLAIAAFIKHQHAASREIVDLHIADTLLTAALALPDAEPVIGYLYRFLNEPPIFTLLKQDWAEQKEWIETPVYTTPQPATAPAPISLTDVDSIAERFAASYASPHHFVMSAVGLRDAAAEIEKQRSQQ